MNSRMVIFTVGQIVKLEAALLLLPALTALLYKEDCLWAILLTAAIAVVLGFAMTGLSRPKKQTLFAKEGFVIVALAWLFLSAIGALPFVLSGEIPSYVDAFFETVSGFTTTGASILRDVESMSHGLLFWRSFTHWIGGMGVLVLMMALLPGTGGRAMHIMRAEVPGPMVGKLVPRLRDTAKILYIIYLAMTVLLVVLLLAGGMPLFDSLIHAFGTAGTGGFGIKVDSMAGYSPYLQWVITVFMLLFGVNFNIYYLLLIRRFKLAARNSELWLYGGVVLVSVVAVAWNIAPLYIGGEETVRHAAFQVAAIISTTGYTTTTYMAWPGFSKAILLLLMFVGGCAGSTAGGLKVSRILLGFKTVGRNLRRMLHPRARAVVTVDGKRVDEDTVNGVSGYIVLYSILFAVFFLIVSLEPFDMESNFSVVATCINNVGPAFGAAGTAGHVADYSALSKVVLSLAMLLGRLEIYPLLLTLIPTTWTKE